MNIIRKIRVTNRLAMISLPLCVSCFVQHCRQLMHCTRDFSQHETYRVSMPEYEQLVSNISMQIY